MDHSVLDVNITSAKGVKGLQTFVNFFSRMRVYAVVSVAGNTQSTPPAKYSGKNPLWNFVVRFYLEEQELQQNAPLNLRIQLRRKRIFGEYEAIGESRVPIAKLFHRSANNPTGENYSFCRLISPASTRLGTVYFSYSFGKTSLEKMRNGSYGVKSMPWEFVKFPPSAPQLPHP